MKWSPWTRVTDKQQQHEVWSRHSSYSHNRVTEAAAIIVYVFLRRHRPHVELHVVHTAFSQNENVRARRRRWTIATTTRHNCTIPVHCQNWLRQKLTRLGLPLPDDVFRLVNPARTIRIRPHD